MKERKQRIKITLSPETIAILDSISGESRSAIVDELLCETLTEKGHKPVPAKRRGKYIRVANTDSTDTAR